MSAIDDVKGSYPLLVGQLFGLDSVGKRPGETFSRSDGI